MMKKYIYFLISLILPIILAGCIATKQDALNIRLELKAIHRDIDQIKKKQEKIRKTQANIQLDFEEQKTYLMQIGGKVDNSSARIDNKFVKMTLREDSIKVLSDKLAGIEEKLFKLWISTIPISSALPSDLYETARNDYSKGNYDLAVMGFKQYLDKYDDSELAPNAQYGLAESYFMQEKWQQALEEFEFFINLYQDHELIVGAYLKKAICLAETAEHVNAKQVFEFIRKEYPETEEAKFAKDELSELEIEKE